MSNVEIKYTSLFIELFKLHEAILIALANNKNRGLHFAIIFNESLFQDLL